MAEHAFDLEVPTTAAAAWHCKYHVTSEDAIATADTIGYTYLETEQYGFDDDVWVIVQPRGKYYSFNFQSQTNNPEKMSKVFKAYFGRKFLIPSEYDILLDFAPIKYNKVNLEAGYQPQPGGSFRFRAKYVTEITQADRDDDTMEIVERLPSLVSDSGEEQAEVEVLQVDPEEESYEVLDDTPLANQEKTNWDGETVANDGSWAAWRKEEAFAIGNLSVTNEEAAAGAGATLIVIIILVVICCVISILERKKIAEEARRASTGIRNSIRRMTGADPDKDEGEAEAPKTEAEIKAMAKANASNKNEKEFLKDMFTEQYKEGEEENKAKADDPIVGLPGQQEEDANNNA